MTETEYKRLNKQNHCTTCPKRAACAELDGICELVIPCNTCEIYSTCTSMCPQMEGFFARGNKRWIKSNIPSDGDFTVQEELPVINSGRIPVQWDDIPWGAISKLNKKIVLLYFIEGKSLEAIAGIVKLNTKNVARRIHGDKTRGIKGSLEKLSYYHKFQKLIGLYGGFLKPRYRQIVTEYFFKYKTIAELKKPTEQIANTYSIFKKAKQKLVQLEREKSGK